MQEKLFLKNKSGLNLATLVDRDVSKPSQGIVVMANGFGANKDNAQYKTLSNLFNKLGYATLRIDLRGRGESEGDTRDSTVEAGLEDLSAAIEYVNTLSWVDKSQIALYGNSYGGGLVVFEASRNPIYSFIILSSSSTDNAEMYRYSNIIDIEKWKKDGVATMFNCHRNYSLYEEALSLNPYKEVEKIDIPALILHGDIDEAVPFSQSEKLHKAIKSSTLITLEGHNHRYDKGFDEVVDQIENWLLKTILL